MKLSGIVGVRVKTKNPCNIIKTMMANKNEN